MDELDDDEAKDDAGDVERDSDGSRYCWCREGAASSSSSLSKVTSLEASDGREPIDAWLPRDRRRGWYNCVARVLRVPVVDSVSGATR